MQHPAGITKPSKQRADALVVAQGLAQTRTRAQALIGLGVVLEAETGHAIDKPGTLLHVSRALRLRHQPIPFVSRGGLKLQAALDTYAIDVAGASCLDIGASTGGFTDLLLQRGAATVVALDVGHNQLAYKLRKDPRVIVRERCHVVHADDDAVPGQHALVVVDVSFISLTRVLPALPRWLQPNATAVFLVKPQFEVGPARIGKGGIVTDAQARADAVAQVRQAACHAGFVPTGLCPSPVLGTKGNQEFLLVCAWQPHSKPASESEAR